MNLKFVRKIRETGLNVMISQPQERESGGQDDYIGISYDNRIVFQDTSDKQVAVVYVSDMESADKLYLEWVEIKEEFQKRGLFPLILGYVCCSFNIRELIFEAADGTEPLYEHLGAEKLSYSDCTELWQYSLSLENLTERIK